MAVAASQPISILETKAFSDDAQKLLTADELSALHTTLAYTPEVGSRIPGTGGVRKFRIGIEQQGKGKRGGGRVIYYFHSPDIPIILLALYAKGEKIDLTPEEKKELQRMMKEFVLHYKL